MEGGEGRVSAGGRARNRGRHGTARIRLGIGEEVVGVGLTSSSNLRRPHAPGAFRTLRLIVRTHTPRPEPPSDQRLAEHPAAAPRGTNLTPTRRAARGNTRAADFEKISGNSGGDRAFLFAAKGKRWILGRAPAMLRLPARSPSRISVPVFEP